LAAPAPNAAPGPSEAEFNALIKTLEDDAARADLIAKLRALTATAALPDENDIFSHALDQVNDAIGSRVDMLGQSLAALTDSVRQWPILTNWAWEQLTERDVRDEHVIAVEHGQPLVFGKNKDKGIRMNGLNLEVVTLGNGTTENDLIVHDERHPNPAYAFLLSRMDSQPGFPTPIGVLRAVDAPRYEDLMNDQVRNIVAKKGKGDLGKREERAHRDQQDDDEQALGKSHGGTAKSAMVP